MDLSISDIGSASMGKCTKLRYRIEYGTKTMVLTQLSSSGGYHFCKLIFESWNHVAITLEWYIIIFHYIT